MFEIIKHIKYHFSEIMSYLLKQLGSFLNRTLVFFVFFGTICMGTIALSVLIPYGLESYFGIPSATALLFKKILLTIAPAFPTLCYATICFDSEDTEQAKEFSADLCFIAWIITIVIAWVIL